MSKKVCTGVGSRIRARRIELGISQEELAKRMGLKSKTSISKVENGEDNITSDRVEKFADALFCSPAYLMGWEEKEEHPTDVDVQKVARMRQYNDEVMALNLSEDQIIQVVQYAKMIKIYEGEQKKKD